MMFAVLMYAGCIFVSQIKTSTSILRSLDQFVQEINKEINRTFGFNVQSERNLIRRNRNDCCQNNHSCHNHNKNPVRPVGLVVDHEESKHNDQNDFDFESQGYEELVDVDN